MKLFVVATILGACLADRLDNKYLPPRGNAGAGFGPGFGVAGGKNNGLGGGFGGPAFGGAGGGFGQGQGFGAGAGAGQGAYNAGAGQAYNARPSADAGAQILRLNNENNGESFSYDFETSNGIRADAQGVATNGVQSQGSFAYKGDDGQDYSITYTADENGFQPQGAHLPTPPPIPEAILKSLEQNARDEAAGIVDDGTYRGEGAGAGAGAGGYSSAGAYSGNANAGYQSAGGARPFGGASNFRGTGGASSFGAAGGASNFGGAGGASNFGAAGGASNFGAAASRQYLAPNAGRGSGSGNFNQQTGYKY